MNLKDLKINNKEREILGNMQNPKTIAQIAAESEEKYMQALTKLMVWEAHGWIKKIKRGRQSLYYLNQEVIELSENDN
ncbi:hypothetical protein HYW74_00875 [Candidatus Pacearchaeota archaeon]|nr:hypothetical protein [Candidatus Pacearchaeota archaeon]